MWGGILPGEVLVSLKEPYYTYGGPYPDLRDILPEIEIDSYNDSMLSVIQTILSMGRTPKYYDGVGESFHVILTEKTEEAVGTAIEALKDNPYVKYAEPNHYGFALDEVEEGPSLDFSVADALRVLRVAAGIVEADPEIATAFYDKDGDGDVTVSDALIVLRIAAKLV